MSEKSKRPEGVPVDYEVWIIKANGLHAKSDPYPVLYQGASAPKLTIKLAKKFDVKPKQTDPEWYSKALSITAPKQGDTFILAIYDKHTLGHDEFMGHVSVDLFANIGKGYTTVPLQAREDHEKDKVSGTVTFDIREAGSPKARELGESLTKYWANYVAGNDKLGSIMMIQKSWAAFVHIRGDQNFIPPEKVQDWMAEVLGKKPNVGKADEIAKTIKLYDDDEDGKTEFPELMNFIKDSLMMAGGDEKFRAGFLVFGQLSALLDHDGHVDPESLRKMLMTFITQPEQRDQEKMKSTVDDCMKEVLDGLDKNHEGHVHMKELRDYCLESPAFLLVVRHLNEIPMK